MIDIALMIGFGAFGLALLLTLYKTLFARDPADRVLALDTMVVNVIALIVLYGIAAGTAVYFEVAIIIAMLGFVSTVAYARYILRGNIIE